METKITFNELISDKEIENKVIKIDDKEIIIKQYLPVNDKLNLISDVLAEVTTNKYNFINLVQLDVYTTIEIIKAYTNIEFDEEASPADIYDKLEISELSNKIIAQIPVVEYDFIVEGITNTISAYYNYKNSMMGMLEAVTQDYSALDLEATDIQKKLADPDNMTLLKTVVDKLG